VRTKHAGQIGSWHSVHFNRVATPSRTQRGVTSAVTPPSLTLAPVAEFLDSFARANGYAPAVLGVTTTLPSRPSPRSMRRASWPLPKVADAGPPKPSGTVTMRS
jgi:hypothetical protein